MRKNEVPGPLFWWTLEVSIWAVLGFFGSMVSLLSWPLSFLFGLLIFEPLRRLEFRRHYWLEFLTVACGLIVGGLPMCFMFSSSLGPWWFGLLGNAFMGMSFLLGCACAHAYHIMKHLLQRTGGESGGPPARTGGRQDVRKQPKTDDSPRPLQIAVIQTA